MRVSSLADLREAEPQPSEELHFRAARESSGSGWSNGAVDARDYAAMIADDSPVTSTRLAVAGTSAGLEQLFEKLGMSTIAGSQIAGTVLRGSRSLHERLHEGCFHCVRHSAALVFTYLDEAPFCLDHTRNAPRLISHARSPGTQTKECRKPDPPGVNLNEYRRPPRRPFSAPRC